MALKEEAIEALAAVEHEQWMSWAQTMMEREPISETTRERWSKFMVPYDELEDGIKEFDRIWARKALETIWTRLSEMFKVEEEQ